MSQNSPISNLISAIVVGGAFLAIGLAAFFYWAKPSFEKAQASNDWPNTTGQVVVSEVKMTAQTKHGSHRTKRKRKTRISAGRSSGNNSHTQEATYHPEIVFEYFVDNKKYVSSNIAMASQMQTSSSGYAYKTVNKYPAGASVDVFYDPAAPDNGVLEKGVSTTNHVWYWSPLGVAAIGALILGVPLLKFIVVLGFLGSSMASSSKSSLPQQFGNSHEPQSSMPPVESDQSTGIPSSITNSSTGGNFSDGITIQ